eukprot:GEMP01062871.1.p1 GENE.GEMP01062871.1~~GEMP01062871.1.p1  ORF type:complete len:399 (+),score=68.26 GEMP01062871.1:83-1279(+)
MHRASSRAYAAMFMTETSAAPPLWLPHVGLLIQQVGFGGGALVARIALAKMHPVVFACVRDMFAAPILIGIAILRGEGRPRRENWPLFFLAAFFMFMNQACSVSGIKVYGPEGGVIMGAWQTSQPIMTLILAYAIGREKLSVYKLAGVALGFSGGLLLVLLTPQAIPSKKVESYPVAGSTLFFFNCLGMSCLILTSKVLLERGEKPLTIAGMAYLLGVPLMMLSAAVVTNVPSTSAFFCGIEESCVNHPWKMNWANQYVQASVVSFYTVVQPITSAFLTILLLGVFGYDPKENGKSIMDYPGSNMIGIVPIILGLRLIYKDSEKHEDIERTSSMRSLQGSDLENVGLREDVEDPAERDLETEGIILESRNNATNAMGADDEFAVVTHRRSDERKVLVD